MSRSSGRSCETASRVIRTLTYDHSVIRFRLLPIAAAFTTVALASGYLAVQATGTAAAPPALTRAASDSLRQFTIAATGDILIHDSLWMQAARDGHGRMDFAPQLAGVKSRIAAADFAICHLETPLAKPGGPFANYPVFNTPPQVTKAIKSTGYDACSTASNHTLDQGLTGIKRTLNALDAVSVGHSGSARSRREANTPRIYSVNGVKIAHLAYAYGFNGYRVPRAQPWCCNVVSAPRMIADARRARAAGAQVVIVSMHAGDENVVRPSTQQRSIATSLARSGQVDLLIGHHAHVVQPAQKIGKMWVVYGHGNLLSGQSANWHRNREGVVTQFTFNEQPDGTFQITRAVGYPTLNTSGPSRLVDLVKKLPRSGGNPRYLEAYRKTRATLLSMGAGRAGFVVPEPGSTG